MIQRLVEDIRKALENNLLCVALATSLALPDICGKAEYPNERSSRKRYIDWYDKEIGISEKNPFNTNGEEMPYLSGEIVYNLRCSFLHAGNPDIDNPGLRNSPPIDSFTIVLQKRNDWDFYPDSSSISDIGGQHRRSYQMSIRRFCMVLCDVAESYYRDNKSKFIFTYKVVDESNNDNNK